MADFFWVGTGQWTATGTGGRWYTTSGGTTKHPGVPTATDNAIFDSNSGTGTCTIGGGNTGTCLNLYCNGYGVNGPTSTQITGGNASILNVNGSIQLSPNQIFDLKVFPTVSMVGTSAATINTNGNTFGNLFIVKTGAGSVTLNDDLIGIGNATLTLTSGVFNANNKNVTFGAFYTGGTASRTLTMGSGTWLMTFEGEVTSVSINTWEINTTTGLTFNKDTATIKLIHSRNEPQTNNSQVSGLKTALTSSATTIDVTDITPFNTVGGSSGYVLIGDEVIGYSGINLANRQLTGLTRGYGGTTTLSSVPTGTAVIGLLVGNDTLEAPIIAGVTTLIVVNDALAFPTSGVVWIENEQISYSGIDLPNSALTASSTPTQNHSIGAKVYSYQAKSFYGGGLTYNNVVFGLFGYKTRNYIYGSNTFSNITNSNTGFTWTATGNLYPGFQELAFEASQTNTITSSFTFTGTSAYQQQIYSQTAGTQTTLRAPTSQLEGVYSVGANSVNQGNNTGLTFASGGIVNYIDYKDILFGVLNYDIATTGVYATAVVGDNTLLFFWTPVNDSQTSSWIPVYETGNQLVIEGDYGMTLTTESGSILTTEYTTSNWTQVTDSQTPNWTPVIH